MITCIKCNFNVSNGMKFALMQNSCPSCGSQLFSPEDVSQIQVLQNKISAQAFSADFDAEMNYDISLFIYHELKNGLGKTLTMAAMEAYRKKINISEAEPETPSSEDEPKEPIQDQEVEEMLKIARKEVEKELRPKINSIIKQQYQENDDDEIEDEYSEDPNEDVDDRVERLKKLHQQRASGKKPSTPAVPGTKPFRGIKRLD